MSTRRRSPAGVALLDVNVLVALFNPDHIFHEAAHDWFSDHREHGWATCALTELGAVRVLANPKYWDHAERTVSLVERVRAFCASGHHTFWRDTISVRDETRFDLSYASGHRQLSDLYLLGLAVHNRGYLATFDTRIPLKAVTGATPQSVAIIAPAGRD
jgi:toxin-antitoxin system PIN domain toxin